MLIMLAVQINFLLFLAGFGKHFKLGCLVIPLRFLSVDIYIRNTI